MDFLHGTGFDVPPGKSRAFQAWVRENATALSQRAPTGIELVGIYATMFSSVKESGHYRLIWRLDSYGAMDRLAAAIDQDAELGRLLDEWGAFQDPRLGAGSATELLKAVADLTIWADYPED